MPARVWRGPTGVLKELSTSPQIDYSDRITVARTYRGDYDDAAAAGLPRGTLGSGSMAGYRVATCRVQRERMGIGLLTINWEANAVESGQVLNPDEYDLDPFDINPKLEYHNKYRPLTSKERENVRAAYAALEGAAREQNATALSSLADNLLQKLKRGTETFYLAGIVYTWSTYNWSLSGTTRGSFIEVPGGPLASIIPADFAYVRQCDKLTFTGQYLKLTRSWRGAPGGYWDPELYF